MPEVRKISKRQQARNRRNHNQFMPVWIIGGGAVVIIAVILVLLTMPGRTKTDPLDKSVGPTDAKVVITEYGDFQCPACKQFALTIEPQLKKDYADTGKARLAFRHMSFIGPESNTAAEASECANEQGHFWDYYSKLYQEQGGENVGTYNEEALNRFATDLKLDAAKFSQCLSSRKYKDKVVQETQEGGQKGVNSTPSVLVNGLLVDWGGDYNKLKSIIDARIQNTN